LQILYRKYLPLEMKMKTMHINVLFDRNEFLNTNYKQNEIISNLTTKTKYLIGTGKIHLTKFWHEYKSCYCRCYYPWNA